jgi:acyl-CoA dehydrogenase
MVPQLSLVRENPLFTDAHQTLSKNIEDFVSREIEPRSSEHPDTEHQFREYLSILSAADLLKYSVAQADRPLDVRSLCIVREALSFSSSLADLVFVMQGLGTYCLALAAPEHIREFWIPRALSGKAIAAFALTEPMAGSEIAGIQTLAVREGESYILNGTKRFITNAGIADFYTIFARTGESEEQRPIISAFVAGSRMPGLQVTERIEMISPHPIGEIQLNSMRIPAENLIGKEGDGHKLALETLDIFRVSVGAAACGMMSRALRESIRYATERKQFGVPSPAPAYTGEACRHGN